MNKRSATVPEHRHLHKGRPQQDYPQKAGTTKVLERDDAGHVVTRTVLPGGLRVITEQVPGVRSAAS